MLKKKIHKGLLLMSLFSFMSCWETDTENAVEDVGEKVGEITEEMGDKVEDASE